MLGASSPHSARSGRDALSGTVRLDTSKSGEPRTFPFANRDEEADELRTLLVEPRERAEALARATGVIVPRVFFRGQGQPIRSILWAWQEAAKAAGVAGKIPHDLRRPAVLRAADAKLAPKVVPFPPAACRAS